MMALRAAVLGIKEMDLSKPPLRLRFENPADAERRQRDLERSMEGVPNAPRRLTDEDIARIERERLLRKIKRKR